MDPRFREDDRKKAGMVVIHGKLYFIPSEFTRFYVFADLGDIFTDDIADGFRIIFNERLRQETIFFVIFFETALNDCLLDLGRFIGDIALLGVNFLLRL